MVEQSEHPFPEGCGFHVPAWQHFLRTLQTSGQATEATLQEGILPWLFHSKAQKLVSCWQLRVVCLPTARVALFVFALGSGLHLVPLLTLGSGTNRGWGGAFPVSLRSIRAVPRRTDARSRNGKRTYKKDGCSAKPGCLWT